MPSNQPQSYDLLVVGAGPAGLAATEALARRDLHVGCIAPSHPPRWPNTYGIWLDELQEAGLTDFAVRPWPDVHVELDTDRRHRLDRAYTLLDNAALRDRLRQRADRHEADWLEGVITDVEPPSSQTDNHLILTTRSGDSLACRVALDATGHGGTLDQTAYNPPGYQTAFGLVVRGVDTDNPPGSMTLMDYRPTAPRAAEPQRPPTFLYSMDLGDNRRLFEETVLVSHQKTAFEYLERRLKTRLLKRGISFDEVTDTERVVIPMGGSLPTPDPDRGLLSFGAAARMVHPATGYMIGRTLQSADPMADAVADALTASSGPESRRNAVRRGWHSIWPPETIRTRHLLNFGLETLADMTPRQTRAFFDAFFSLPDEDWRDYLAGTASPGRTARIMWRVFSRASFDTKTYLTKMALSPHFHHLVRSLAP